LKEARVQFVAPAISPLAMLCPGYLIPLHRNDAPPPLDNSCALCDVHVVAMWAAVSKPPMPCCCPCGYNEATRIATGSCAISLSRMLALVMFSLVMFCKDVQRAARLFWPQRYSAMSVHWPGPSGMAGAPQTAKGCACPACASNRAMQCELIAFQVVPVEWMDSPHPSGHLRPSVR
jgi:hypothetical protein